MTKTASSQSDQTRTPPTVIGLLAHVDAGKTTLAEALLYTSGKLRHPGRVDHQDAFLDTYAMERQRGITIFSKQASFTLNQRPYILLDTPGHVDFSPETERTLRILDYAIIVISGADGIQSHLPTLWKLLQDYRIPAFLFINKMDQAGCDRNALMRECSEKLSDRCIDFSVRDEAFYENLATAGETALEQYLDTGRVDDDEIRAMTGSCRIYPCFFGSALKLEGIEPLLRAIQFCTQVPDYPDVFSARIFKIAHDERGERLTYLKVTGGSLKVKSVFGDEKINQIRLYDGGRYVLMDEAPAGTVCAVTGLSKTAAGDGLGAASEPIPMQMVPVMRYRMNLPEDCDVHETLRRLSALGEEEPQLHLIWKDPPGELHLQVMGEVQLEVLKHLILERYGLDVTFDNGTIIYKETICSTVEGVGHFEPLRHYAEVHLLIEPAPRGSGITIAADCSEDLLDRNWQRLILTHLKEKEHCGVLTGSALTDVKITLKAGRAHIKHTQGGDFRQAAYRAVRQGLMQAQSLLLEPYDRFRLELPAAMTGRAIHDLQRMHAHLQPPVQTPTDTVLTGRAPAQTIRSYPSELISFTHGSGHIFLSFDGYDICHNPDEVIAAAGYDPDQDPENPSASVFCSHGSGYVVPWNEATSHMHLPSVLTKRQQPSAAARRISSDSSSGMYGAADKELAEIFERTYGSGSFTRSRRETAYNAGRNTVKHPHASDSDTVRRQPDTSRSDAGRNSAQRPETAAEEEDTYLLVDGYNIIFAWEELRDLALDNAQAARGRLMDILCNYQGYLGMTLILVFDAYRVKGNPGHSFRYHNIYVVYTKEAETADQYIEKTVHRIGRSHDVTVATSDALEQVIILGQGARRMSAADLHAAVEDMTQVLRRDYLNQLPGTGQYLFDNLTADTTRLLERIRLGQTDPSETSDL